jgi:hypothetical protein
VTEITVIGIDVDVNVEVRSDGAAVLDINPRLVTEIINSTDMVNAGVVEFDLSSVVGVTSAVLPTTAFRAINSQDLNLKLDLPCGSVTFGNAAMSNISMNASAGGNLRITIAEADMQELNDMQAAVVGNNPVFRLGVHDGNRAITNFGGPVEVSLSYQIGLNEDPNTIVIYYVDGNGNLQLIKDSRYENGRVIFTTTHFSLFFIAHNPVGFTDIGGHWAQNSIVQSGARNMVSGFPDGRFLPDNNVTRAEFIQMVNNALDLNMANVNGFVYNDVTEGMWFYNAIGAAKSAGLLSGIAYPDGNLLPNNPITRQEMADVLAKVAITRRISVVNDFDIRQFNDFNAISESSRHLIMGYIQ